MLECRRQKGSDVSKTNIYIYIYIYTYIYVYVYISKGLRPDAAESVQMLPKPGSPCTDRSTEECLQVE